MLPGCVPFPEEFAERYRQAGYWRGERLGDLLRRWAEAGGDRVAVSGNGGSMSYAELDAAADRVAAGLRRLGLSRGDRVVAAAAQRRRVPGGRASACCASVRCRSSPCRRTGSTRSTTWPSHSEAVAYLACDTFGGFHYGELGAAARKEAPSLRHILLLDGPDDDRNGVVNLRRLLDDPIDAAEARAAADADPPDPSDVALFLLSGGTTGLPKLIPRTHDDYAYNITRLRRGERAQPVHRLHGGAAGGPQLPARLPGPDGHAGRRRARRHGAVAQAGGRHGRRGGRTGHDHRPGAGAGDPLAGSLGTAGGRAASTSPAWRCSRSAAPASCPRSPAGSARPSAARCSRSSGWPKGSSTTPGSTTPTRWWSGRRAGRCRPTTRS